MPAGRPSRGAAPERAPAPASGPAQAAGLLRRGAELRRAAAMPGADLASILEAALAEVDAAVAALGNGSSARPATASAERRLLHAVFSQLPVPVFLVGQDQTIRRANAAAAALLGSAPGYVTGKQLTALVDLADRGRVATQLASAFRTGQPQRVACGLLGATGLVASELTLQVAGLRSDADQLIVAVGAGLPVLPDSSAGDAGGAAGEVPGTGDLELVRQLTRRLDVAAELARLLLEDITVSESALVQRCARLLAGSLAPWVIVDSDRRGQLRRQFVAGPDDPESDALVAAVSAVGPEPGTIPWQVHESGSAQLITHAEDPAVLGTDAEGHQLLMLLRAASVLSVPLTVPASVTSAGGQRGFGSLTLLRGAGDGHFGLADAAAAEAAAEQLALAIRASRAFRRHSAVAQGLQSTLLPEPPHIPGVQLAAAHVAADGGPEVGGDFYDIHQLAEPASQGSFGLAIGDVCGPARNAAAVTSAARHAIRTLARREDDPAAVLRAVNDVLLAEQLAGEFVTAHVARLAWAGGQLHVRLGSAGQPAPALITADGRVRLLRGGGQPLGIFPDARPAETELDLAPGDTLLFCTDGVADARSLELGYFADRLADELAALAGMGAAELAAQLRRRALEFCDGAARDDMTVLVLRVTQAPDD